MLHPNTYQTPVTMAHSIITCGEVHLSVCFCHTGMILKGHCFAKKMLSTSMHSGYNRGRPSLSSSMKPLFHPGRNFKLKFGDLTVGFGRCLLPLPTCLPSLVPCLCNLPSCPAVQPLPGYHSPSRRAQLPASSESHASMPDV